MCVIRVFLQIEAGEIVYYLLDYWHQTLTVSDHSISVTGTLVDANCYKVPSVL